MSPPLRLLSLLLQAAGLAEVVLAGEQTMGGGLHSTLCPPFLFLLLFLTDTNREAAEELTEVTSC